MYESSFTPSNSSLEVLRTGKIIDDLETGSAMINRVVSSLVAEDSRYGASEINLNLFEQGLGERMDDGRIVMSTPIMTNAGRYYDRPLSACTMPTVDLKKYDAGLLKREINILHQQGMGTGFDLDPVNNPVEMLQILNDIAVEGAKRAEENRPVGNMAVLSVYHPRILDFIRSKTNDTGSSNNWKFNISVNVDDNFFDRLASGKNIVLADGKSVPAERIFNEICESATKCADPGLIFLDRMNNRNPVPGVGKYRTTAPCAEVGLVPGESCQFGYINLSKFIRVSENGYSIDYDDLQKTTTILTRALDDALSISIDRYLKDQSVIVMERKRKIGIGICGVADLISIAGLDYSSEKARNLASDMLAFINYQSKLSSMELAESRGSAKSMYMDMSQNRYLQDFDYLTDLYGQQGDIGIVGSSEWKELGTKIRESRLLRNTTTVALPPTGRSALIYDSSTGVEPHFTLERVSSEVRRQIAKNVSRMVGEYVEDTDIERFSSHPIAANYLACANDIDPNAHMSMVASLQKFTDEAISKTINMPENSSPSDVSSIYRKAFEVGLSGITIYVNGSHNKQPVALSSDKVV